jgi:hypothetical protein
MITKKSRNNKNKSTKKILQLIIKSIENHTIKGIKKYSFPVKSLLIYNLSFDCNLA